MTAWVLASGGALAFAVAISFGTAALFRYLDHRERRARIHQYGED